MCASTFRPPCKVKIPIRRAHRYRPARAVRIARKHVKGHVAWPQSAYWNLDLTAVADSGESIPPARTFARKLTCSQADSGVPMRTQSQPQFPHELLSFRRPRHDGGSKLRWQNLNEWPLAKADLFCLQSGRPLFHNRKCPDTILSLSVEIRNSLQEATVRLLDGWWPNRKSQL